MTAIVRACSVQNTVKNTGVTCNKAMAADAMIIATPPGFSFTDTDLLDPLTWIKGLIHAAWGTRVLPMFGQKAPIRTFEPKNESDVVVILDDGSSHFLRYGFINVNYETTNGGLCYMNSMAALNAANYNFLRIDKLGQILARDNGDGTYGSLVNDFAYSPAPVQADLKTTPFKNRFMISFDPQDMIDNGVILSGAKPFLSLMGLIDGTITKALAATTTILKIGVVGSCVGNDLVALLGANLGTHVNNFLVYDKTAAAFIVPSSAAIVAGHIELTGVYPTGHIINVIGGAPSALFANNVVGYDLSTGVDITIP